MSLEETIMKMWLSAAAGLAVLGLSTLPSMAQQKTAKACQAEWQANKEAYQAAKVTQKAYVDKCRAGETIAVPTTPATPTPTPTSAAKSKSAPTTDSGAPEKKTAKACQAEWQANKEAYQTAKITQKAYVEKCRAGETVALPSTPATPAPTPTAAAPADTTPAPTTTPSKPAVTPTPKTTTATPTAVGQFTTEAEAKSHCASGDIVVWANLTSKIYHFAGARSYGKTKKGAYICEHDATSAGFRASKTEKRPSA
jgi:hypothetical protein